MNKMNEKIGGLKAVWQKATAKQKFITLASLILIFILAVIAIVHLQGQEAARKAKQDSLMSEQNRLKKQFVDQLPELQKKAQQDPNNISVQQQLGVAKYATGDLQGAKDAYEKASSLDQNNAVIHNNLGNTYRDLGNYAQAESEYRTAMKLNPKLTTPYLNLGSVYQYILARPDTALDIYKEGIKNNPDYVDLYNVTASVYEQQGLTDKAAAQYKKALEIQPNNQAATAGLKRLGK